MIKVKGYRVLIKPDIVELKTESGILIAGDKKIEQAGQQYGTVVQFGDQCWPNGDGFEVDEYVVYARYQGRLVTDPSDGEQYLIMNDEDVLASCSRPTEKQTLENAMRTLNDRREVS